MNVARSYVPFAFTVNYTSIVDAAFARWTDAHNDEFLFEPETGLYVYNGRQITVSRLVRELWPLVTSAVFEVWDWVQTEHPEQAVQYLFVVNPCSRMNPETGEDERWKFGEEGDVRLNFPMFAEAFGKVFDKLFKLQVKNKNSNILYLQRDGVSYGGMVKLVVRRVFGNGQTTDLSAVFVPRHVTEPVDVTFRDDVTGTDMVVEWIGQTTGLRA